MGVFRQKVLLVNADDKALAKRKMIPQEEVRELEVKFLVDTGAYMLCINEEIQNQFRLGYKRQAGRFISQWRKTNF